MVVLKNESHLAFVEPEYRIFALKEFASCINGFPIPFELLSHIISRMYYSQYCIVKLCSRPEFLRIFITERNTSVRVLEALILSLDTFNFLPKVMSEGIRALLNDQHDDVQPNLILRQQGYVNKILRTHLSLIRKQAYLVETVLPVVQKIVSYSEKAELEHVFLEDNGHHDLVMKNTWSFENFLTILLQSLFSSSGEVPIQMKELIWIIKTEMNVKFPHHTERAIATVISLFIIPFIVSQSSAMRAESNSSHLINTILQVLQHLSNDTLFRDQSSKSVFLNSIIARYQPQFNDYIIYLIANSCRREYGCPLASVKETLSRHIHVLLTDLDLNKLTAIALKIGLAT